MYVLCAYGKKYGNKRAGIPPQMFPQYTHTQALWESYRLKEMFSRLCWEEYRDHVRVDYTKTRFSLNLINRGLIWHHDMVHRKQNDLSLTVPGMTLVVHLGSYVEDVVYLEYFHDLSNRTVCRPGTVYVFPGYAIRHRSVREFTLIEDPRAETPRYSLAVFFAFKKSKMRSLDNDIHERFPYYNDNYEKRIEHFDALYKKYP